MQKHNMSSADELQTMSSLLIEDWADLPVNDVLAKLEDHRRTKVFFPMVCDIYNPVTENIFMSKEEEEDYHQTFVDRATELSFENAEPIGLIDIPGKEYIRIYLENEKYYFANGGDKFLKTQHTLVKL